jgi:hypothetical protein
MAFFKIADVKVIQNLKGKDDGIHGENVKASVFLAAEVPKKM